MSNSESSIVYFSCEYDETESRERVCVDFELHLDMVYLMWHWTCGWFWILDLKWMIG